MSTFKTTSYSANIDDVTHIGGDRVMQIYDKKVVEDISDVITDIDPYRSPFTRLMEAMGTKEACDNYKPQWMDQDNKPLSTTIVDSGTSVVGSDTEQTLVVADNNNFVANDVLNFVQTDGTTEVVKVLSKDSPTTYTIQRGYQSTEAISDLAEGDYVVRMGNAFAENTLSADPDGVEPNWFYNFTQTFKKTVSISRRMDKQIMRGNKQLLMEQLEWRQKDFNEDVEVAMMFGNRAYESGTDGETSMGGVKWFLDTYAPTNVVDFTGVSFVLSGLNQYANTFFRYGNKKKMAIVSGDIYTKISDWGNAAVVPNDEASESLGMEIKKVKLSHGELNLVHSRTLDETPAWAKSMFLVDPQFMKKRYLNDSDTQIQMNIQENDRDGRKHQILADCSLEVRNPQAHFYIQNVDTSL
jgi:hypothetical protein